MEVLRVLRMAAKLEVFSLKLRFGAQAADLRRSLTTVRGRSLHPARPLPLLVTCMGPIPTMQVPLSYSYSVPWAPSGT